VPTCLLACLHLIAAVVLLVAACGASPSSPTSAEAPGGRIEFTVMTFNIQHGLNGASKYDTKWAVDTIARVQPDLVGLQELTRNHATYNCEDQPAKIADGLTRATGARWHAMYQQEWFTHTRTCVDSGRGDGVETEGLGFFAPDSLPGPVFVQAWNGRIGLVAPVRRANVPVIVTHLAHGSQGHSDRMRQLDTILPWTLTAGGSGPRIFIGDFNFHPDSPEYSRVRAEYRDAWEDARAAGTARGRLDGITHKSDRIDYVFYKADNRLELLWLETVDTRSLFGTEPSDHNPVVARFALK
jgi:endonuclease/exonuclease/phosphatase family metal-dependent hydrolase